MNPLNLEVKLMHSLIKQRDKNLDEIIHFQKEYEAMVNKSRWHGAATIGSYINSLEKKNIFLDSRIMEIANANKIN